MAYLNLNILVFLASFTNWFQNIQELNPIFFNFKYLNLNLNAFFLLPSVKLQKGEMNKKLARFPGANYHSGILKKTQKVLL